MDTVLSVGMSHQAAMGRRMDVVANNIANASTTAYRAERVTFQDYLFRMDGGVPPALRELRMVLDYGMISDMRAGSVLTTNNPLDIALDGRGFVAVETETGERLYTRAGNLRIDDDGALATQSGEKILGTNGQPIEVAPEDVVIEIGEDGIVRSEAGEIGQILLVDFDDMQALERRGNILFATDQPEVEPQSLRIIQGALEGSNVNGVEEVTEMISVLRSYQAMERTLQSYGELRDDAIERLSRVQA